MFYILTPVTAFLFILSKELWVSQGQRMTRALGVWNPSIQLSMYKGHFVYVLTATRSPIPDLHSTLKIKTTEIQELARPCYAINTYPTHPYTNTCTRNCEPTLASFYIILHVLLLHPQTVILIAQHKHVWRQVVAAALRHNSCWRNA